MVTSKHYAEVADFLIKAKRYSEAERALRAAQNHVDWKQCRCGNRCNKNSLRFVKHSRERRTK